MAVNYSVQAEVVDIRRDTPKPTDAFLVDSNVWLWIGYPKATPRHYQVQHYPVFVQQARKSGATLRWCGLSLAEIAHNIEKLEREIFVRTSGQRMTAKEFRHNRPKERSLVAAQVHVAWTTVAALADPLDATIDESATNSAVARFQKQLLDGYDLFLLEAMTNSGLHQILTDDGDYCTVAGIQVFTANRGVIDAARVKGKLVVR